MQGPKAKDCIPIFLPAKSCCLVLVTTNSSYKMMQSLEIKTRSGLLKDDEKLDGTVLGGLLLAR